MLADCFEIPLLGKLTLIMVLVRSQFGGMGLSITSIWGLLSSFFEDMITFKKKDFTLL